ncbi:hypothetical protein JW887_04720 [Candidatus Dojkabacteria bacterium]|nr:hypothetical protein [Candidatus Dojkabacteria bacterium]
MKNPINHPIIKNILKILIIVVLGFILLNVVFLLDFAYQSLIRSFLMNFLVNDPEANFFWIPLLMHGSFAALICVVSYFVLKTRISALLKATYMSVPICVVLVTVGIFLYRWQVIAILVCLIVVLVILTFLRLKKLSWEYYFSLIFYSSGLLIMILLGVEI